MVNQLMHQRTIYELTLSRLMLGTAQLGLNEYGSAEPRLNSVISLKGKLLP